MGHRGREIIVMTLYCYQRKPSRRGKHTGEGGSKATENLLHGGKLHRGKLHGGELHGGKLHGGGGIFELRVRDWETLNDFRTFARNTFSKSSLWMPMIAFSLEVLLWEFASMEAAPICVLSLFESIGSPIPIFSR